MRIPLSKLLVSQLNVNRKEQIPDLVDKIKQGDYISPIRISEVDDNKFRIEDGTHRAVAYILSGKKYLEYGEFELVPFNKYRATKGLLTNIISNDVHMESSIMKFDDTVNTVLVEKFGAPSLKRARRIQNVGSDLTSRNPNVWKDPLKRHSMQSTRGMDRKKLGWVPRTHQTDVSIPMAQRILDVAKDADEGIWKITKAQAVALSAKYRMHVPNDKTPAKRLGSTGIVMWRKTKGVPKPEMFLVKHEKLIRSGLGVSKKIKKLTTKKKKGRSVFKGSFKSTYKAKKPKKPIGPTFEPGKVGT